MLDIDFGTYPYVTSSNTGVGGDHRFWPESQAHGRGHRIVKPTPPALAVVPSRLNWTTRASACGNGGEFGATTGRLAAAVAGSVVIDHACDLNGVDTIALTKLDVLGEEVIPADRLSNRR